jgi:hypothetical protein
MLRKIIIKAKMRLVLLKLEKADKYATTHWQTVAVAKIKAAAESSLYQHEGLCCEGPDGVKEVELNTSDKWSQLEIQLRYHNSRMNLSSRLLPLCTGTFKLS